MFENIPNHGDISKGTKKAVTKKTHLLNTALTLFQEKGYQETTMRDIAKHGNVGLGTAYYYFKGKNEIVFAFYQDSLGQTLAYTDIIFSSKNSIECKLDEFFDKKFEEMKPYRGFLKAIAASSFDSNNPISPLNSANKEVKDQVMSRIQQLFEDEKVKMGKDIRPIIGSLVWHLHMALLLYWIYDRSENQENTAKLKQKTLSLMFTFLGLSKLPIIRGFNKVFVDILITIEALHDHG